MQEWKEKTASIEAAVSHGYLAEIQFTSHLHSALHSKLIIRTVEF